MNKRMFFLAFTIFSSFIVGFFTGKIFTEYQTKLSADKPYIIDEEQQLEKESEQEDLLPAVNNEKALMAYVQDFRNPDEIAYDQLTHVIFSFAHPTTDGNVILSGESALNNLRSIVAKSHDSDTKAILAVGGWSHLYGGESYDYFQAAISDPITRKKLVQSLMNIVEQEDLDGIDIDFEHPRSLQDAKFLTDFTKEMSDQLHPAGKELSIAVHSKINAVTLQESDYVIYEPSTFQYVDHINIMAYDGQWDDGYQAENLSPFILAETSVSYWTNLLEQNNIAKDKLILGVPFYAQPEDATCNQVSYATIISNDPNNANSDTAFLNGTNYYYNGLETMAKKANLVLDNELGGMMIWEAGHDVAGSSSLTSVIYQTLFNHN